MLKGITAQNTQESLDIVVRILPDMSHMRRYPDWILSEQYVKYISCSENIKLQNGTTIILARIGSISSRILDVISGHIILPVSKISHQKWTAVISGDDSVLISNVKILYRYDHYPYFKS